MLNDAVITQIKEASNVVDVIEDFGYNLKRKSGDTYTCLCPFHDDRHEGSFMVSQKKNYYRCFSCGAHGSSVDFLMYNQGMKFTDAVKWLGVKYGLLHEDINSSITRPTVTKPHTPPPPLPMLCLPEKMVTDLKVGDKHDNFCDWVRELPWQDDQAARCDKFINNYLVGHGREGHTVFWQVDETGKVRTGKMMLYKTDGHRDKESAGNFNYVHARLLRYGYWDDTKNEVHTCLFGQHMLDFYPNATICIVESEKTALLMAIAYGDPERLLWMACGGKSNLNREKLEPLIQRRRYITLYPDKDGAEDWRNIAAGIGYDKLNVNTMLLNQVWIPEDGPKADFADIIVRRLRTRNNFQTRSPYAKYGAKAQKVEELKEQYPNFKLLVEKFKLKTI